MAAAEVFMDSAGFLALWDAGDEHHAAAIRLQKELARKRRPFLTTEYVVDETVTLLLVRHSHNAAVDFLDTVERSEALRLEWIGPERFHAACALFRNTGTRSGRSPTASASALCASCAFVMRSPPTTTSNRRASFRS